MESNYFECPICGKVTRHIEVKLLEVASATGGGKFVRAAAAVSDWSGGAKVIGAATGYRFWKCAECTSIFTRDAGGTIQNILKEGTPKKSNVTVLEKDSFYISQNTLNIITINQTFIIGNTTDANNPIWLHKHDGYKGSMLDKYKIIFHFQDLTFEKKRGLVAFLTKLTGEKREQIEWSMYHGPRTYTLDNLVRSQVEQYENEIRNTEWYDYMEIV